MIFINIIYIQNYIKMQLILAVGTKRLINKQPQTSYRNLIFKMNVIIKSVDFKKLFNSFK